MEFRPILSAMLRNKTGAILIALQIAITLAIVCNAVFIIQQRLADINRPTGLNVKDTFVLSVQGYTKDYNPESAIRLDLDALRALPGVVDATSLGEIPLSGGGWSNGFSASPEPKAANVSTGVFHVDSHGLDTLGVKLVAGRNFKPADIVHTSPDTYTWPPVVILTRAAADKLFPKGDALGKTVYSGKNPLRIIGIVDRMQGSWVHWSGFERNAIVPTVFLDPSSRFLVRTEPGARDRVMKTARKKIEDLHAGNFVLGSRSLEWFRNNSYEGDRGMATILMIVTGMILVITAFGIVGLASFSVNQRRKQIGTRRALGARRRDILRYFLLENWIITSFGVIVGTGLAVALNIWLVNAYELTPIAWYYIPIGIIGLWLLGLISVLGPALRAARVSPALATRTV